MTFHQQRGLSVIELLVAITVLGIMLSMAVPTFSQMIQNNRDEALRNLLTSYLQQARAHAIIDNRTHVFCGSSDGITCNKDWRRHWLIISTRNSQPIQLQQLENSNLCWRGFSQNIIFRPNGTSPISNGKFNLCRDQASVWELTINRQGRVRQSGTGTPGNCCTTNHTDG